MKPFVICLVLLCTACATYPPTPRPIFGSRDKTNNEMLEDQVACQAIAAQSATGAGAGFSDPALRAGFFEQARAQYLEQCLMSRGWTWITPQQFPATIQ